MKFKKIKAIIMILFSIILILETSVNKVYASTTARDRSKLMLGFYDYNNFTEEDAYAILEGAYDKTAVRLMGIYVSNWLQPGMSLSIGNEQALVTQITSIITDKMNFPADIAGVYATQIATNMLLNLDKLEIYQVSLGTTSNSKLPYYFDTANKKSFSMNVQYKNTNGTTYTETKTYDYKVYDYMPYRYQALCDGIAYYNGTILSSDFMPVTGFSYLDGDVVVKSEYIKNPATEVTNKIALNQIMWGNSHDPSAYTGLILNSKTSLEGLSGYTKYGVGYYVKEGAGAFKNAGNHTAKTIDAKSFSYARNDIRATVISNFEIGNFRSDLINRDEGSDVYVKPFGLVLQTSDGKVVWDNTKTSCQVSGIIARNYIVTGGESASRIAILGSDSTDADGSKRVFKSKGKVTSAVSDNYLMVDCFGNIVTNTGFVVIPACMNPYTFDSSGEKTILVNNFAMGYLYETDTSISTATFRGSLGYTSTAIKRRQNNGVYNMQFYPCSRLLCEEADLEKISTSFNANNISHSYSLEGTGLISSAIVELVGEKLPNIYNIVMPTGLIKMQESKDKGIPWYKDMGYTQKNGYGSFFTENSAVIDLVRLGGTWEYEGQWASLIDSDYTKKDSEGSLYTVSTICKSVIKKTDKYGNIVLDNVTSSQFIYGIFCTYATILTGENFTYEREDGSQINVATTDWKPCGNFKDVVVDDDTLAKSIGDVIYGSIQAAQYEKAKKDVTFSIQTILSPKPAFNYITGLINQRIKETLLGVHYDTLGLNTNTDNSMIMGTEAYSTENGYTTVPEIRDISIYEYILNNYDNVLAIFGILVVLIMTMYVILRIRSIQKAFISVILFMFSLFLIPLLLSSTVEQINKQSSNIMNNKFNYWALAQQQSYMTELNSAYDSGNVKGYLSTANSYLSAYSTGNTSFSTLRWQTPKKDDYISQILGELNYTNSSSSCNLVTQRFINTAIKQLAKSTLSGEIYLDPSVGYLYRNYIDISMYAKIMNKELDKRVDTTVPNNYTYIDDKIYSDLYNYNLGLDTKSDLYRRIMNKFDTINNETVLSKILASSTNDRLTRYRYFYVSDTASGENSATILGVLSNDLADSNNLKSIIDYKKNFGLNLDLGSNKYTLANISSLTDLELSQYQFLLYTESPFYYIFNNFSDVGTLNSVSETAYKDLLLSNKFLTSDTIKRKDGSFATRDYVDFEGFFRYVLPLLRASNEYVIDYDKKYGLEVYKEASISGGESADFSQMNAEELDEALKVAHNNAVRNVWSLYSPWLDLVEDCSYTKKEKITTAINGKIMDVTIEDVLNPASYEKAKYIDGVWYGRKMIFGEEDMIANGLTYEQLTSVEQKIYNILEDSKKDLIELLNYYSYDNQVLTTAASMSILFNFNKEFSESKLIGDSTILYPQGYELKNFSYDSYLRMTLANSTGMNLVGDTNAGVYQTIIDKNGIFVGILMVLNDLLAIYVLTYSKMGFVIILFALGFLSILCSITSEEKKLFKTFSNNVILGNIWFLVISLGHTYVSSLIIGKPNTTVINTVGNNAVTSSPKGVLMLLLLVHLTVCFLYIKILIRMTKKLIRLAVETINSIGGVFTALSAKILGTVGVREISGENIGNSTFNRSIFKNMNRGNWYDKHLRRKNNRLIRRSINSARDNSITSESKSNAEIEVLSKINTNISELYTDLNKSKNYKEIKKHDTRAKEGITTNTRNNTETIIGEKIQNSNNKVMLKLKDRTKNSKRIKASSFNKPVKLTNTKDINSEKIINRKMRKTISYDRIKPIKRRSARVKATKMN